MSCGLALTSRTWEPSQLHFLVPLVRQERLKRSCWELSRLQAQFTAAICSGVGQSAAPPRCTGRQQAGEQGTRVWQLLLAWLHEESISFLVYSESYSEFTVWD